MSATDIPAVSGRASITVSASLLASRDVSSVQRGATMREKRRLAAGNESAGKPRAKEVHCESTCVRVCGDPCDEPQPASEIGSIQSATPSHARTAEARATAVARIAGCEGAE